MGKRALSLLGASILFAIGVQKQTESSFSLGVGVAL